MSILKVLMVLVFVLGFLSSFMAKQKPLSVHGNKPIPAKKYQRLLGVGIDVDWMSFAKVHKYYFYWRSKGVNIPSYFKKEGFSNVRIRISEDVVNNKTALKQLADVVNDCLKAGIIPIISYGAPELRKDPTNKTAQEHFVLWWTTVAKYFRNYSYLLSYDLLIESSGPIKSHPEVLNKVYSKTIKAIRKIDPHRIIIVTPAKVSSPFYLKYLNVSNDGYIMAEWHIYAGGPKHCTYNLSLIKNVIATAKNWSNKTKIPLWFGAWRPYWISKKNKTMPCSIKSIENFTKVMSKLLKKNKIPNDINADVLFFNIENLTWIPSRQPILEIVLDP